MCCMCGGEGGGHEREHHESMTISQPPAAVREWGQGVCGGKWYATEGGAGVGMERGRGWGGSRNGVRQSHAVLRCDIICFGKPCYAMLQCCK